MFKYISTRGMAPDLGFADVTLTGLAKDGGLYVPERCPQILMDEINHMAGQSYLEIAQRVIYPFVDDDLTADELMKILQKSYLVFDDKDITPLHALSDRFYVMELFHGPTLAFKDIAMQFLGNLFDFILEKRGESVTIVGATSGDTGSAAIEAFQNKENVNIIILHPHGRVSDVQRRQMTTVQADNVWNIAIEGDFDACQNIVKALFNDHGFRAEVNLSAVNSINWARIVAQVVYYVYGAAKIKSITDKPITFSVPTGNFGNVYAGYVAKHMGIPIDQFMVATNSNDILHRFFATGCMEKETVTPTLSPSMDIQISSNFERMLFDFLGRDGDKNNQLMTYFAKTGPFDLDDVLMAKMRQFFVSDHLTDDETLAVMRGVYDKYDYIMDPHTAVGVGAGLRYQEQNPDQVIVSLATAHPAKFPDAVEKAIDLRPNLPDRLFDLQDRLEKYDILPASLERVQGYILERIKK